MGNSGNTNEAQDTYEQVLLPIQQRFPCGNAFITLDLIKMIKQKNH